MLAPGAVIGILGGGQLGRMLAQAASALGFDVHVYAPEHDSPAARVAARVTIAPYDDAAALAAFAKAVDVVTYEFENVPAETAAALAAAGAQVRPGPRALDAAQDRLTEKSFLAGLGVPVAPHEGVGSVEELPAAFALIGGGPAILKTRRFGYDGLGQARVKTLDEARLAFRNELKGAPAILEKMVTFEREISLIAARGEDGEIAFFDLCDNEHSGGILRVTRAPAQASPSVRDAAHEAGRAILAALDYVGVLTIEFFLTADGALIANEIAPRVHNSGHWTIEGAATSQFAQHIRAVVGWPLGETTTLARAEMINLVGGDVDIWPALVAEPGARLHLYGKHHARPGRKMGHVTRLSPL